MKALTPILWLAYFAIAVAAVALTGPARALAPATTPGLSAVKYALWIALLAFLAYSLVCSRKEPFFRSVRRIAGMWWGRQIGIDLYLGLAMMLVFIFLTEPKVWVAALWIPPMLVYANLITLLYFVTHFDALVGPFAG